MTDLKKQFINNFPNVDHVETEKRHNIIPERLETYNNTYLGHNYKIHECNGMVMGGKVQKQTVLTILI